MTSMFEPAPPYQVGDGCCAAPDERGAGCPHQVGDHEDGSGMCQVLWCPCVKFLPHTDRCVHNQQQGEG